jgi:Domain of Unknown Function with PDB structure (DUF3865)
MNEFHILTKRLHAVMAEEHMAVHPQRNPVVQILKTANIPQLTSVLQQYSIFPKAIVLFLEVVRDQSVHTGWHIAVKELNANIAEELGSETQGISHADLLVEGLEICLGVSVKAVLPSIATAALVERLKTIAHQPIAYAFGATYAIEATAVMELKIVIQILDLLLEGTMPEQLRYFFDMHLNEWEPEHEANLRKAIVHHLTPDQFNAFETGFRAMLMAMDAWWSGLAAEALTQRVVTFVGR